MSWLGDRDVERLLGESRADQGEPGLPEQQQEGEDGEPAVGPEVAAGAAAECRVVALPGASGAPGRSLISASSRRLGQRCSPDRP